MLYVLIPLEGCQSNCPFGRKEESKDEVITKKTLCLYDELVDGT